jgi:hypothetical protein
MFMRKILTLFFISFLFCQKSLAQIPRDFIGLGIGTGMTYGDNTINPAQLEFKLLPSITGTYSKQLSDYWDIRGNIGGQFLNSGEFYHISRPIVTTWGESGQAYFFRGYAYFLDVMPMYQLNPNIYGVGETVNFYVGAGLGVLHSNRTQRVMTEAELVNGVFVSGTVVRTHENLTTGYIPVKLGLSTNFEYNWDLAVEFTMMTLFSSDLDGNNIRNKPFKPDAIFNAQIILKRYLGRY